MGANDLPLKGGCNCGAVRFEVTEPLVLASYCHCTRCQRRSGAASSANAHPAPGAFRIVAGERVEPRRHAPRDSRERNRAAALDAHALAPARRGGRGAQPPS